MSYLLLLTLLRLLRSISTSVARIALAVSSATVASTSASLVYRRQLRYSDTASYGTNLQSLVLLASMAPSASSCLGRVIGVVS